jgi:hypothetical protein
VHPALSSKAQLKMQQHDLPKLSFSRLHQHISENAGHFVLHSDPSINTTAIR